MNLMRLNIENNSQLLAMDREKNKFVFLKRLKTDLFGLFSHKEQRKDEQLGPVFQAKIRSLQFQSISYCHPEIN